MNTSYLVGGYRSAVGKAPRGAFRFMRPDDLAVQVIQRLLADFPQLSAEAIDDVIVGCAAPEAEQGLNMGRMLALMGLNTDKVPGMTINRYCASGLEAIAIADAKIKTGQARCILAGGVESMSLLPFGGWRIVPNYEVARAHPTYYWGMGLTAEEVARRFNVSREDQDAFGLESHRRAVRAQQEGRFDGQIAPVTVKQVTLNEKGKRTEHTYTVTKDEGPRPDTSLEALAKLKPVFQADGTVTAGNASQTSDGAAFVLLMEEKFMQELGIQPIAVLRSYATVGLEPAIMGVGPIYAIPKALRAAGLSQNDIDVIELNEAFASQSLAIIRHLDLDTQKVNPNGGAIALGHPLGCTGAKLTVQVLAELKRIGGRYGMVTMCVGTGQGAAGIFERLN
ncbi:MAG: acetyl-CoA C-acyltransferase [Flavobacteriales bacterium]|nr:acetyl-CoA C-acyltransferase [Flavobacteriales bacterium]